MWANYSALASSRCPSVRFPLYICIVCSLVKDNGQFNFFFFFFMCVETKGTLWWLCLVLFSSATSVLWPASLCLSVQDRLSTILTLELKSACIVNNSGLSKKCHFSSQMRVSSATFQTEVWMFAFEGWLETSPIPHVLWPLLSTYRRKRKQAFLLNSICHGFSLYLGFFRKLRNLVLCSNNLQGFALTQFSS